MERVLRMIGNTIWFIEANRAMQIVEALEYRLANGSRREPYLSAEEKAVNEKRARVDMIPMPGGPKGVQKTLARIPLIGTIMPRGSMEEMSGGGGVNLTRFQSEFQTVANDPNVGAILLEIDSPGGDVSLVPETAAMIRNARRSGRPIVAQANVMACSAAYWIAAACDEVVVTPSGVVGSIGVFTMHEDHSEELRASGVNVTIISEGPRKVEGNPFGPMDDAALNHRQADVRAAYEQFTSDVAAFRNTTARIVRADPEGDAKKHFGGGRYYSAPQLKSLGLVGSDGMVDRIATMQQTVDRLTGRGSRRASTRKAKLAML